MTSFAFVFPGQGSQTIGMLDAFSDNSVVRSTIEEASDCLQMDMASLISHGPKEQLDSTTNTQPVMLAAAVAIYRAWIAAGGSAPKIVAGHSLGEYAALVAAGVIDFRDAIPLVRFRADSMQKAVPIGHGGMAAILGLDDDAVRSLCLDAAAGEVVEAVNYNAPSQVVIAGHKSAVDRACILAKERGAKRALPLSVSAPFHSSLLLLASAKLRDYLASITFSQPQITLINNVDVASVNAVEDIKDALVRQAASPVRWVETVQAISSAGITHVIECGPGKVLTGLVKRIDAGLNAESINDPASLNKILESLN
jgi:[acyl-carrier-protein] S-malonyltransferase